MEKKRDSFKSDDELVEEEEHRRQTRRRLLIIAVSSIVLVAATVGILVPLRAKNSSSLSVKEKQSIKSICSATLYQESCYSSIYSLKQSSTNPSQSDLDSPKQIFMLSLQVSFNELINLNSSISVRRSQHSITQNALNACSRLIQDAMDHVNMSIASSLQTTEVALNSVGDVRTWLSTAITDQQTCLDGLEEFENIPPSLLGEINASMVNATIFTSNSLAIISKIPAIVHGSEISVHRKVLQKSEMDFHRRRLVEADLRPNLTVAKDGSGDYETITEAVNAMPKRSKHKFFIYVKEGEYNENVVVDTNSWNLMMYGDGMGKTVVSSNLNHVDGVGTYNSATLSKSSQTLNTYIKLRGLEFNPHVLLKKKTRSSRRARVHCQRHGIQEHGGADEVPSSSHHIFIRPINLLPMLHRRLSRHPVHALESPVLSRMHN